MASMTAPGVTLSLDQASTPPVGSEETTRFPSPSPATHNDAEGHEIDANQVPGSTSERCQVDAPPVGLVDVTTLPLASTATHSVADGQATDWKCVPSPSGGVLSIGPVLVHANTGEGVAPAVPGKARVPREQANAASSSAHRLCTVDTRTLAPPWRDHS